MTTRERFKVYREWRLGLEEGEEVGIFRQLGAPSTGRVVAANTSLVRVRDAASGDLYHFRGPSGSAVSNSSVFLVPVDVAKGGGHASSSL